MKQKILLFTLLIAFVVSCRKYPDLTNLTTEQVVATDRDLTAQFNSYSTYYISDSISVVASSPNDSILTGPLALQIVGTVKANMSSRGYTFAGRNTHPDLALRLTIIKDITRTAICGGWWDGWYGGYPPCYYGYCGGYYYPWCTTYTYTIGTSSLYMYDLKNTGTNHNIKALWGATLFGAFSQTNNQVNADLTTTAINQAYKQSPYIQK